MDLLSFVQHGPGIWKFNNPFLSNEFFCQKTCSAMDTFSMFEHAFLSVVDFWEALKQELKQISVPFSRTFACCHVQPSVIKK